MQALVASDCPPQGVPVVDTFIVIPPRIPPFRGLGWMEAFDAYLKEAFPKLTLRVSTLDALREHFDPVVMPIMGTAGTGNVGGRIAPMTAEIEQTKQNIAASVLAFDPAVPARIVN